QRVSGFAEKVAGSLRRLMDAAALTDCLNAINREHAHPIAAVSLVDFASFEGSPALLVAFTDVMRENWVWVVGPDCGPASASMRYRAKVG
ncbi:MAG TPA: hypothetical protein VFT95_15955, partial [Micromonosporaceae bacterium]|nr:hypothetical protein [Micromonosporaceae bacterium]